MKSLYLATFLLLAFPAFSANEALSCAQAYEKIYRDSQLDISLFLGYGDNGGTVLDPYDRASLAERLAYPCGQEDQFCGFIRDKDDADIFTKTITRANGKKDKIRIRLMNSAVSSFHADNTGKLKAQQERQSARIKKAFLQSLTEDEVVIYEGHARRGTGPGFQPMGTVDWAMATANKSSLNDMVKTLKTAKTKPALIGMLTCEGESHYGKILNETVPDTALLLTRQTTTFNDTREILMNSVNAILKKECANKFRNTIKDSVQTIYSTELEGDKNYQEKLPEVYGLFEPITKKFAPARGVVLTLLKGATEESTPIWQEEKKQRQRKVDSPR